MQQKKKQPEQQNTIIEATSLLEGEGLSAERTLNGSRRRRRAVRPVR